VPDLRRHPLAVDRRESKARAGFLPFPRLKSNPLFTNRMWAQVVRSAERALFPRFSRGASLGFDELSKSRQGRQDSR
jgi:hypothetical protein